MLPRGWLPLALGRPPPGVSRHRQRLRHHPGSPGPPLGSAPAPQRAGPRSLPDPQERLGQPLPTPHVCLSPGRLHTHTSSVFHAEPHDPHTPSILGKRGPRPAVWKSICPSSSPCCGCSPSHGRPGVRRPASPSPLGDRGLPACLSAARGPTCLGRRGWPHILAQMLRHPRRWSWAAQVTLDSLTWGICWKC